MDVATIQTLSKRSAAVELIEAAYNNDQNNEAPNVARESPDSVQDEYPMEDSEQMDHRQKRRRPKLRFDERVRVSAPKLLEADSLPVASRKRRREDDEESIQPTQRVNLHATSRWLNDKASRKKEAFRRSRRGRRPEAYVPGTWASPAGYEKVDTGFSRKSWQQLAIIQCQMTLAELAELAELERQREQERPQPERSRWFPTMEGAFRALADMAGNTCAVVVESLTQIFTEDF